MTDQTPEQTNEETPSEETEKRESDAQQQERDQIRDQQAQQQQQQQDEMAVRQDVQPHVQWRDKHGGYADTTGTLEPLMQASAQDWLGSNQDPDVLLAIPNLGVDHIGLKVKNLKAHVELHAKVLDLLELHVGADASIEEVDLQIDNVRVQAMLKVKLEKVAEIVDRVMTTIDNNPEILTNLTAGLGKGLEAGLGKENAVAIEEGEGRLKGVEDDTWEQSPEVKQPDWSKDEEES